MRDIELLAELRANQARIEKVLEQVRAENEKSRADNQQSRADNEKNRADLIDRISSQTKWIVAVIIAAGGILIAIMRTILE